MITPPKIRCKKSQEKGLIPYYFCQRSVDQLVKNTITGHLITLVELADSEGLELLTLCELTAQKFSQLRNLKGQSYNGDLKRSVTCALTSNGVFKQLPTGNYMINKENARIWEDQTRRKMSATKQDYEQTKRKYKIVP